MNIDINVILSVLDKAEVAPANRSAVISLAVARAVGYGLSLPTECVNSPSNFFILNKEAEACSVVSQINETIAIDVTKTCDMIRGIWLFRYRMVFDSFNPAVRNFIDGILRVGLDGLPSDVSPIMIDLADSNVLEVIANIVRDGMRGE